MNYISGENGCRLPEMHRTDRSHSVSVHLEHNCFGLTQLELVQFFKERKIIENNYLAAISKQTILRQRVKQWQDVHVMFLSMMSHN